MEQGASPDIDRAPLADTWPNSPCHFVSLSADLSYAPSPIAANGSFRNQL